MRGDVFHARSPEGAASQRPPKKRQGGGNCELYRRNGQRSVVMIVIIPIAIGVPAMTVFIPPAMVGIPAAFSLRTQFVAPVIGLSAVGAMMLDGFVQFVIVIGGDALAIVISAQQRGTRAARNPSKAPDTSTAFPTNFNLN